MAAFIMNMTNGIDEGAEQLHASLMVGLNVWP